MSTRGQGPLEVDLDSVITLSLGFCVCFFTLNCNLSTQLTTLTSQLGVSKVTQIQLV